jgi:signal peptidase II
MKAAYTRPLLLALIVIVADQAIKNWVRTHMNIGDDLRFLGNRGMLHYTLNNGMAFGMEFGGSFGKLFLTFFRIGAVVAIGWGLVYLIKHKYHRGLIMTVALIFAGALGNIIDSTFYGILYQGTPLFRGQVIDMFYFPLFTGHFPSWFPGWGGEEFIFFRPVFNLADAAISVGVITILINQKRYFKHQTPEISTPNSEVVEE